MLSLEYAPHQVEGAELEKWSGPALCAQPQKEVQHNFAGLSMLPLESMHNLSL